MAPDNRIAVVPGSYDPITLGHLDVITRAAKMYDEVIVAVVNHPLRKAKTLFGVEERCRFVEEATAHLENVRAQPFSNLIVDFALCTRSSSLSISTRTSITIRSVRQRWSSSFNRLATPGGTRSSMSPPKVASSFTPLERRKLYLGPDIR